MAKIYVFYSLQNEQYKLQFNKETIFIRKDDWDRFSLKQRICDDNVIVSGVLEVIQEEFTDFLSDCEATKESIESYIKDTKRGEWK